VVPLELPKQQPTHKVMNHQNGFTLIELLLVVVVLMIFMASAVFYMSPALRGAQLEEGAARFESMFKFASAEATQTGRRVLVRFVPTNDFSGREGYIPRVLVERNPTGRPGEFTELQGVSWLNLGIGELVTVTTIAHLDDADSEDRQKEEEMSDQFWSSLFTSESASDPDGAADGLELAEREGYSAILGDVRDGDSFLSGQTNRLEKEEGADSLEISLSEEQDVLFYPDGSSETVELRLISCDEEDQRIAVILLNGITGLVERKIYTPSELTREDELEDSNAEEDVEDGWDAEFLDETDPLTPASRP